MKESGEPMNEQKKTLSVDQTTLKNTYVYTGALAILAIAAIVIFGLNVLLMIVVAYATGLAFEFLFAKLRKKPLDYGWMVTPLLVALLLPPTAPWWLVMYTTGFGLVFGKLIFGGSGKYIFNPALVGALFAYISFAQYSVAISWPIPGSDLLAGATPLLSLNRGLDIGYSAVQLLLGQAPGATGETFRLGIIVLGLALIALKVFDWKVPLAYLGTVFVVNGLGVLIDPSLFRDPVMNLLVGGLLFGAFFLAGDQTIAPKNAYAKIIYGVGLGLLTVLIRVFATWAEGVTFALIIMSAISPLIDSLFVKKIEEATV